MRLLVLATSGFVSVGCEQTFATPRTSADVETKDLGLFVSARSNGLVTQVFVSPQDKHGSIAFGLTDQFLIAVPGQTERAFVTAPRAQKMAQIPGDVSSFAIVLVRKDKRYTTQVEMPPRFSLEAHYEQPRPQQNVLTILTNWTPSSSDSTMILAYAGPRGRYETPRDVESSSGSWPLSESEFKLENYLVSSRGLPSEVIVTATRKGGKITRDPALGPIQNPGMLEQIRTTVVGPPPPPPPPSAQVAADPAQ